MKQTVHKEEIPTAKVCLKSYSASLAIRKMEDKTVLGFCRTLVLVRMSPEHPPPNKKGADYSQGCGEKGPIRHCWWEFLQPLSKSVWRFYIKLNPAQG